MIQRRNGDIFEYRREVGGRVISVNRHLRQLYPFMNVEKAEPQERIPDLNEDGAAGTTALRPSTQHQEVQDEVSTT